VTRDAGFDAFFARRYEIRPASAALVLADTDLAEDAAQEAFARALGRRTHAGRIDRPDGWVVRVGLKVRT
jgi:predicted RNA polymerase sigma factor